MLDTHHLREEQHEAEDHAEEELEAKVEVVEPLEVHGDVQLAVEADHGEDRQDHEEVVVEDQPVLAWKENKAWNFRDLITSSQAFSSLSIEWGNAKTEIG